MKIYRVFLSCLLCMALMPAIGQNVTVKPLLSYTYSYFKPETGESTNDDSTRYVYNNSHQVIEKIEWRLLPSAIDWGLYYRIYSITYDAAGHRLTEEQQYWTGTTWFNNVRYAFVYDAEGRKTQEIREAWSGGNWVPDKVTVWEYDSMGHLLSETSPQNEILNTYNSFGHISTRTISQTLNGGGTIKYRQLFEYWPLSDSLPVSEIWQQWNMNAWENTAQFYFEYNPAGKILTSTNKAWDGTAWYDKEKTTNTYNMDEKLIYSIKISLTNGTWENDLTSNYKYDADGDLITIAMDKWYNGNWSKFLRTRYHYEIIGSQNTPTDSGFSFYPNPASDAVRIKSGNCIQVSVLDQHGRPLHVQILTGQSDETVQLGNLPPGSYFLEVLGQDGTIRVKALQIRR